MVRPACFGFNEQTAVTNGFQQRGGGDTARAAQAEFDGMVTQLRCAGLQLCVVEDTAPPTCPDAVFPNNWVSLHADGTVALYPMCTPNRRAERREPLLQQVMQQLGFCERRRLDLTAQERDGRYLEGTGSLVLDSVQRVAYACRSPRTDEALVNQWCQLMDYEPLVFDAATPDGQAVYHTNVLLWIGARLAGVGLDWIAVADRPRVLARLQASGRDVLPLPQSALQAFAGNMLELRCGTAADAKRVLVASSQALARLPATLLQRLQAGTDQVCAVDIPLIETVGGGSVRCMLAEVPV